MKREDMALQERKRARHYIMEERKDEGKCETSDSHKERQDILKKEGEEG